MFLRVLRTLAILLVLSATTLDFAAAAKKDASVPATKAAADSPKSNPPTTKHSEPVIEDVTAKQLEKVLNEKDYVAVFWCK